MSFLKNTSPRIFRKGNIPIALGLVLRNCNFQALGYCFSKFAKILPCSHDIL